MKIPCKEKVATMLPFYAQLRKKYFELENKNRKLRDSIAHHVSQRHMFEELHAQYLELKLKYEMPERGTKEWFEVAEFKYGGLIKNVERKKVSDMDPRTQRELHAGGMVGGDRMSRLEHGYAQIYEECLHPFLHNKNIVLAEVGILKGTGLAIWSELFDDARIMGFDIDLCHCRENMSDLRARGAFKHTAPELYEFDQYLDNRALMEKVLHGDRLDIIIDDGVHYNEAIIATVNSLQPFFSDDFLYIIEDNATVHHQLRSLYPDYAIDTSGEITLMRNRLATS